MSAARLPIPSARPQPSITVRRLTRGVSLAHARILAAVHRALDGREVADLNVAIVNDARMAALHAEYLGDDRPTDVLTFDLRDRMDGAADDDQPIEGEIVVSADTARREALRRGLDPSQELTRYIIHGVLHLLGMNDLNPADRRRMRREEDRILAQLAEPSPPIRSAPLRRRRRAGTIQKPDPAVRSAGGKTASTPADKRPSADANRAERSQRGATHSPRRSARQRKNVD